MMQSCQLISISYYNKHSITDLSLITIQIKTRRNYSIRNIVGAHCQISGIEALQTETPARYSNSKLILCLNTIYIWDRGEGKGEEDWCHFGCNELPLQYNDARHFWQIKTPLEIYQIPIRYLYIPAAYYKKKN